MLKSEGGLNFRETRAKAAITLSASSRSFKSGEACCESKFPGKLSTVTMESKIAPEAVARGGIAEISRLIRLEIGSEIRHLLSGGSIPTHKIDRVTPISRAAGQDFELLLRLWSSKIGNAVDNLPPRPCPACGSDVGPDVFRSYDGYLYRECTNCQTWYVPKTSIGDLITAFLESDSEATDIASRMTSGRGLVNRDEDRRRFSRYFSIVSPLLRDRSCIRYLDIGCGVGHSLRVASELGWRSSGIEISPVAVEVAKSEGSEVCMPQDFEEGSEFDVISLFETLEHLQEPAEVLSIAERNLAPNGVIIITIPNRLSYEISTLREKSFHVYGGFDGVGHINIFDQNSLETLLSKSGFQIGFLDAEYSSNIFDLFLNASGLLGAAVGVPDTPQAAALLPKPIYDLLNWIGPAVSLLERTQQRSPILIAVACRTGAYSEYKSIFAELVAVRDRQIKEALSMV